MDRWLRFSGILGLVLFSFGLIGALVSGSFERTLVWLHLAAGVVLILVSLFSSRGALGNAKSAMLGRRARLGYFFSIYTILFVGLLVTANWLIKRYDRRWDLTEEGVYSLSLQSRRTLESLKQPLKIVAFSEDPDLRRQLELYRFNHPQVTVETVNPRTKPQLAEKYGMKPGNQIYLAYGAGSEIAASRINDSSEDAITNGIIKLTRGAARKLYYLIGHGEPGLDDRSAAGLKELALAIEDEHLSVEPLTLATTAEIPSDAAALLMFGPQKQFYPQEIDRIESYVNQGGSLLLLTDPRGSADARTLASRFGITIGEDVVIDQVIRLFGGPEIGVEPIVRKYGTHPITRDLNENDLTVFSLASSVTGPTENSGEATYTVLASTGPASWAETNLAAVFDAAESSAALDPNDPRGPISLAVAYERTIEGEQAVEDSTAEPKFTKTARLLVFGDSDWVKNERISFSRHRDLILNCLGWLTGEAGGISIRPRYMKPALQPISRTTILSLLASSLLVPELILIFGLVVWWRRRTAVA